MAARNALIFIMQSQRSLGSSLFIFYGWLHLFVKRLNNEYCSSSSPQGLVFSAPATVSLCFHHCSNKGGESNRANLSPSWCAIRTTLALLQNTKQNGHANKKSHCCATGEYILDSFAN